MNALYYNAILGILLSFPSFLKAQIRPFEPLNPDRIFFKGKVVDTDNNALPKDQQALKEIERIKGDKTLRTADPKTYYTELTDVLRTYMEERFGFNAMEMTSSEIIDKLQEINDKESIKDLMYLFQTADLVKFAKHSPLMNENDMNLVNAVDFINNTKVEPDPNAKPEPTEITVEEKRSKQGRMILLGSISIIVIAIVVILYKVLSGVYNLWF